MLFEILALFTVSTPSFYGLETLTLWNDLTEQSRLTYHFKITNDTDELHTAPIGDAATIYLRNMPFCQERALNLFICNQRNETLYSLKLNAKSVNNIKPHLKDSTDLLIPLSYLLKKSISKNNVISVY